VLGVALTVDAARQASRNSDKDDVLEVMFIILRDLRMSTIQYSIEMEGMSNGMNGSSLIKQQLKQHHDVANIFYCSSDRMRHVGIETFGIIDAVMKVVIM
jgi:hypothetical protein